jgi:hypothetical protein
MVRARTRPTDAVPVRLELTPAENELVGQAALATGERYRSVFARRVVVEAARAIVGVAKPTEERETSGNRPGRSRKSS